MHHSVNRQNSVEENDRLLDRLAEPVAGPDLTERIMHRLGFMQVAPHLRRRRIFQHWSARLITVAAFATAIGAGVYLHGYSDRARRVEGPTLHLALPHDFDRIDRASQEFLHLIRPEGDWPQMRVQQAGFVPEQPGDDQGQQRHSRVPWSGLL